MTEWLHRFEPPDRPVARLVCFPHAGGNAAFFRPWTGMLGPSVEIVGVQYPGRRDRIAEPPLRRLAELVDGVTAALAPLRGEPLALFGHSLGALVALETARRLAHPPVRLVVSGRGGPQHAAATALHRDTDAALVAELRRLGGTASELLDDPAVQAILLPAVRADYEVSETYRPAPVLPRLRCPLTVLVGDADPEVPPGGADGWRDVTDGQVSLHVEPGDHFFLVPRQREVLRLLRRQLAGPPAPLLSAPQ